MGREAEEGRAGARRRDGAVLIIQPVENFEDVMPIYAYKCASCGHEQDVLQKISDAPLTVCTSCGASAFGKQLTAAGFQLKGSGWYATDFKNGNKKPDTAKPDKAADTKPDSVAATDSKSTTETKPATESKSATESKPATESKAPPAACGAGG
jgi:putative FmdB family regulatory protein